jgi:hypothetical protein
MNTPTPDQTELEKILTYLMLDVLAEASKEAGKDIFISTFPEDKALAAISKLMRKERLDEVEMALSVSGDCSCVACYYLEDRIKSLKKGI